jgi:uncharacterized protein (DUF3820 family)
MRIFTPSPVFVMLLAHERNHRNRPRRFRNLLVEISHARMPFGKFGIKAYPPSGVPLMDLPIEYLAWFKERGFPKGRLGELMAHVCEIKEVGMDSVFDPLREAKGGRFRLQAKRSRSFDFD